MLLGRQFSVAPKGRMIAMPILKAPLSVRRPFLKGNLSIESIELDAVTLDAGEEYELIMASRDDAQLVYIVVGRTMYLALQRDLDRAATAP
jgi:hypothetical protein